MLMKERKMSFSTVKLGRTMSLETLTLYYSICCSNKGYISFSCFSWTYQRTKPCVLHVHLPAWDIAVSGELCVPLESSGRIRVGFGYSLSLSITCSNSHSLYWSSDPLGPDERLNTLHLGDFSWKGGSIWVLFCRKAASSCRWKML